MSGTSADGIDAVLITTEGNQSELVGSHHRPMPAPLRDEILAFRQSGRDELHRLATLDVQLAEEYAVAVSTLLKATQLEAATVAAIGCHGQTLRHQPEGNTPFTLQIGDPNRLAELTGITVVSDFRRRDMAAGGQGAPLVPAFHRARLVSEGISTAVVNIGGIANISLVTAGGDVTGWDTGPGNTLMDAWIAKHQGEPFDRDGEWAASGAVIAPLLGGLLQDPYFALPPPKSTGPEYFHLDWLATHLSGNEAPADVQCTLAQVTVESLALALAQEPLDVVRVCGGGARNTWLMQQLTDRLGMAVTTTEATVWILNGPRPACPVRQTDACRAAWQRACGDRRKRPTVLGGIFPPEH